jgi:hypothetical protein
LKGKLDWSSDFAVVVRIFFGRMAKVMVFKKEIGEKREREEGRTQWIKR